MADRIARRPPFEHRGNGRRLLGPRTFEMAPGEYRQRDRGVPLTTVGRSVERRLGEDLGLGDAALAVEAGGATGFDHCDGGTRGGPTSHARDGVAQLELSF